MSSIQINLSIKPLGILFAIRAYTRHVLAVACGFINTCKRTKELIIQLIKTIPFKVHRFILSLLQPATHKKLTWKLQMKSTFSNSRTHTRTQVRMHIWYGCVFFVCLFWKVKLLSTIPFYRNESEMDHFFSLLLEIDNQHESTLVSGLLSAEKNWNLVIERQTFVATTRKCHWKRKKFRLKIIGFEM